MRAWFSRALVLSLFVAGCRSNTNESFTPPEVLARKALVDALEQWKAGQPIAAIDGEPVIQIADTHRKSGQALQSYEVQGEVPMDYGRCFQVKVQFSNPAVEEKIQYVVVGKNPIWVYRKEDYDMLAHWDMQMPEPAQQQPESAEP
jgi:hypothetical protein